MNGRVRRYGPKKRYRLERSKEKHGAYQRNNADDMDRNADVVQPGHELHAIVIEQTMQEQREGKRQKNMTRRYRHPKKRKDELRAAIVDTGLSGNEPNDVHPGNKPSHARISQRTRPVIHRSRGG